MTNKEELIAHFERVKEMGWIETKRHGDQCLGNTFEDLIGKKEDNKSEADFKGFELKAHRTVTKCLVSLFSKAPSYPKRVNTYLREKYGVVEDAYAVRVLNTMVSGAKENTHRGGHGFKLVVDREKQRIYLQIRDLQTNEVLDEEIYWTFSVLAKALDKKIKKIAVLYGDEKVERGKRFVRYTGMKILEGVSLEQLVTSVEKGKLLIDIRIGVYASGKKMGKTHDHGTAFRVQLSDLLSTYGTVSEY